MREWVQSSGEENMRDRNNDGGLLRARRSATKMLPILVMIAALLATLAVQVNASAFGKEMCQGRYSGRYDPSPEDPSQAIFRAVMTFTPHMAGLPDSGTLTWDVFPVSVAPDIWEVPTEPIHIVWSNGARSDGTASLVTVAGVGVFHGTISSGLLTGHRLLLTGTLPTDPIKSGKMSGVFAQFAA